MKTEVIWAFGMSALARLRTGDERGAYEAADRALAYIVGVTPVAYWTLQGMAATAEVVLSSYEAGSERDGRLRPALARRARRARPERAVDWRGGPARPACMTCGDVAALSCPRCRGPLGFEGTLAGEHLDRGTLRCGRCAGEWPVEDGIPDLVDEAEVRGLDRL